MGGMWLVCQIELGLHNESYAKQNALPTLERVVASESADDGRVSRDYGCFRVSTRARSRGDGVGCRTSCRGRHAVFDVGERCVWVVVCLVATPHLELCV